MISQVIITNRDDAKNTIRTIELTGIKTCWITISNTFSSSLVKASKKHILNMKFNDIRVDPITKNQTRKIKNFIFNHHLNMKDTYFLVINCHAGISRSAGIGMFCKQILDLPVEFQNEPFPNEGVMKSLGIYRQFQ